MAQARLYPSTPAPTKNLPLQPKYLQPTRLDLGDVAQLRAKQRFQHGVPAQNALLERVARMVIRDRLVPASAMHFRSELDEQGHPVVALRYGNETEPYTIHRHPLAQLAQKVQMPLVYLNMLNTRETETRWKDELLCHSLNELFHEGRYVDRNGTPTKFLHRLVGTELRGFLSRRFNRHLASAPLLRAFVAAAEVGLAKPVEAIASDVRLSLKCFLPEVFEAFPGQYVCIGVEWGNSDFGSGKLQVSQTLWDPLRDTRSVLDDTISKVHLGSIIEDSDIEMSDETASKEVDAQASAIRDAVLAHLSTASIKRVLEAIAVANEHEIPWNKLKGMMAKFLYKKDLETVEAFLTNPDEIIDLPAPGRTADGKPIATKWWASSVVSYLAAKTEDDDRRLDLQHEAGRLLGTMLPKVGE